MPCRRQFLKAVPLAMAGGFAVIAPLVGETARAAMLGEQDPQAQKLGYKAYTASVDNKKYPKHTNTQTCANCQLYQGDKGSAAGGCVLFGDKEVTAGGWCGAWEQG
jgi:hypothetical protein